MCKSVLSRNRDREISIRAFGRRGAELEIIEVFEPRPGLAADAQPDTLIRR